MLRSPAAPLPLRPLWAILVATLSPSSFLGLRPISGQEAVSLPPALGNLAYRHIGPANVGGRVSAIVGIPGDPSTYWVGGADGGVWRTTNGGVTFEGQWQDAEAYSVGALAWLRRT